MKTAVPRGFGWPQGGLPLVTIAEGGGAREIDDVDNTRGEKSHGERRSLYDY